MKKILFALLVALSVVSCSSYKNVPYFQNAAEVDLAANSLPLYDARIMPKDILMITVNCTDPEAAAPFNLTVQNAYSNSLASSITSQPALQQYLVDNEGNIDFPVVGTLHMGGLSRKEAESMIKDKLKPYLKETPIVNVRMTDFKVSVIGEVKQPGQFTISKEKVNVLEALALAGDMTIYGIRDDVQLIREDGNGVKKMYSLNLNDANIINSPYYQMQQNDILYVKPNKTVAKNSDVGQTTSLWFSATSILLSVVSLLYNILN